MDLDYNAGEDGFRQALREFLDANPPPPASADDAGMQWQRALHRGGWVAPHWPIGVGGRGCSPTEYATYLDEMGKRAGPPLAGRIGINMVGPTLLAHGTADQQQRYLPRILSGEEIWCEVFSEPEHGSDLRFLTTQAIRSSSGWTVSGQKVWSSAADRADFGLLLARTHDTGGEHAAALTCFVLDMHLPGVDVRPIRQMTGETEFAEVFLDEVCVDDSCVVGLAGQGWRVINTTLANERGLGYPWQEQIILKHTLDTMLEKARATSLFLSERIRLAELCAQAHVLRLLNIRALSYVQRGVQQQPGLASVTKLWWASYAQSLHEVQVELDGIHGVLGNERDWRALLWYRQASIAGGTSEIQRNLIAERALGLPRERRSV